jgi:hypothetical protein
MILPL